MCPVGGNCWCCCSRWVPVVLVVCRVAVLPNKFPRQLAEMLPGPGQDGIVLGWCVDPMVAGMGEFAIACIVHVV